MDTALALAREAAGIADDAAIELITFPRRERFDLIEDLLDQGLVLADLAASVRSTLGWLGPMGSLLTASPRPMPVDDRVLLLAPTLVIR